MSKEHEKPKVGDRLYMLNVGNAAWRTPKNLVAVDVVRVGRKYFYTKHAKSNDRWCPELKWHLDDWGQENGGYSPDYQLYKDPQDWKDKEELTNLNRQCRDLFGPYTSGLSLSKLRRIKAIIDESEEADE